MDPEEDRQPLRRHGHRRPHIEIEAVFLHGAPSAAERRRLGALGRHLESVADGHPGLARSWRLPAQVTDGSLRVRDPEEVSRPAVESASKLSVFHPNEGRSRTAAVRSGAFAIRRTRVSAARAGIRRLRVLAAPRRCGSRACHQEPKAPPSRARHLHLGRHDTMGRSPQAIQVRSPHSPGCSGSLAAALPRGGVCFASHANRAPSLSLDGGCQARRERHPLPARCSADVPSQQAALAAEDRDAEPCRHAGHRAPSTRATRCPAWHASARTSIASGARSLS